MNKFKITIYVFILVIFATSCEKYLEEEPRGLLTADYLTSTDGVNAALNAAYSDLRFFYGGESAMNVTCNGTDEWQRGPDGSEDFALYKNLTTNGQVGTTWNWGYGGINTANAVIEFAPKAGFPDADAARIEAEAKYIRATWYFLMVQIYGDCVLNTEFISSPSTEAYRTSADSVYSVIISDLEYAKENLPAIGAQPGRADAASAIHLLSKVYLTRATREYGKESDYQSAYDNAMELINNQAVYNLALLEDFGKVFEPRNEYNTEVIFTVERGTDNEYNDLDPNVNGNKNNRSSFFFRPHYQVCTDYGGLARTIEYGRPWIRVRPTNYLLKVAFADKTFDTRYWKTFQTVWLVNDEESLTNEDFALGDTAIWLPSVENFKAGENIMNTYKVGEYFDDTLPDGSKQTVKIYPSLKKYDDIDRPDVNDASVRPFIVHKFSETYLIAAEAAMYLGMPSKSVELLSTLRARAAYDENRTADEIATARQQLINAIPTMSNLNEGISFILDERSRELCGEYMRHFDLVRTKTESGEVQLIYRVQNLEPALQARNAIRDINVLYPIPQGQDDLTSNDFFGNAGNNGY